MRRSGKRGFTVVLFALLGCADGEVECDLESTVGRYTPACDAVLALFGDETRLVLDDRLEVFLPPDVQPQTTYGGTTGNPMTTLLDGQGAVERDSTLTFSDSLDQIRLELKFDDGRVEGWLTPTVVGE